LIFLQVDPISRDATEKTMTQTLRLVMPRDGLHNNDWKYVGRMVPMDILGGLLEQGMK